MANETKNAQEYVGKVIVVGDNMATIEIKGVQDNGMLSGVFKKGDAAPIAMPVTIPNLEAMMKRGVWKFQDDTKAETEAVQTTPTEDCSIKTQSPNSGGEAAADKPKAEKPKPEVVSDGKLVYETYTSSKGKACARILGFKADDAAYKNAIELHGSASWNTTKDGRVLYIAFGPKYAAAAKQVCEALNAGKTFDDCRAIIEGTPKANAAETKTEKTYTLAEVAAKLKKLLPEGDKASVEDIKKLLEAA